MKVLNRTVPATLFAAVVLAGCSAATDNTVESALKSELPELLGPADKYEVDVEGVDAEANSAQHVSVVGYGIHPRQGPAIDRLELELRDIHLDRKGKRLDRVDNARVTAWISASDLGDFLGSQDGIRSANVTLGEPDSAFVRVRPELAGLPVPPGATLEVAGTIQGRGPFLEYRVSDVNALGAHMGDAVTRRFSRLINPLIDLSGLPLRLDVTRVHVEGRSIRVDADGEKTALRP